LESAGKLASTTGAKAVSDAAEIFDSKDDEAVFVCTSTNTHVDYLKRSAQAGKAVYCEKPIGLDYQEAVDAVGVVRTVIMMGELATQAAVLRTEGVEKVVAQHPEMKISSTFSWLKCARP
jgi:hypothetical protein